MQPLNIVKMKIGDRLKIYPTLSIENGRTIDHGFVGIITLSKILIDFFDTNNEFCCSYWFDKDQFIYKNIENEHNHPLTSIFK